MIAHPDETAVMGQRGRLAMVRELTLQFKRENTFPFTLTN
jgi:hypothetical protein